ncbi:MAG: hypothetical protein LBH25_08580 [Fibromonadaceae bacterium]|jgi:hypothetical protein|nr:hypothetical protein [Fibromonadaceae bacterium]
MDKVCLGVEISQNGLKIALVKPKRKKIIKVDVVPTPSNSMHDAPTYASVISTWTRNNLPSKVAAIAVAFPSSSGIMRCISMPREVDNPESYAAWEFTSAINTEISDYKLKAFFYPSRKRPARAVVSALRKSIVDSFCSPEVERSGFRPDYLIADIYAMFNLLEISEGIGNSVKCILKADEKFAVAFWADESGPISVRALPGDCISEESILGILESGFMEFPKAKKVVKFCGELCTDTEFTISLVDSAVRLKNPLGILIWDSVNKFSLEKNEEFSKLPQCLGAVGATLSCI